MWRRKLSSIEIPDGVEEIGSNAFDGCTSLSSVTIPDSVKNIGSYAFYECASLESVTIPDSVTSIGQSSFSRCDNLKKVFYPDTAEKTWAFPENADRIAYKTNGDGSVTVTNIEPAGGSRAAEIPDTINGLPVASVDESVRDKVSESGHTHKFTNTDRKEPTCTEEGNIEYRTCIICGRNFSLENDTNVITDTVLPKKPHTLTKTERVDQTCTENGNIEYWTCSVCSKIFNDEKGLNEINDPVIYATGHFTEKTEAKDPTCTEDGNIEYWTCSECSKTFSDEYGSTEITNTVIPKTNHSMVYTERKAPTCINDGNIEYWTCSNCHKYFSDSAGTNEITIDDIVQKATGIHNYVDGVCTVCGGSDPNYSEPTETSPSVTEPPVTDPSNTEPNDNDTTTEPPVTAPGGTEPNDTTTEPSFTYTKPTFTEPPVIYPPYTPPTPAPAVTETAVQSDREQPFIQGDSGKSGWDAISDIISNTPDGGTVTVDMNNSTMLPKDIVSKIKGRDIDLVLIMKNKFVWTINGTDVTNPKNVNMKVQRSINISDSTVEEYFGDTETVQIRLAHNGDFGFTAELSVSLGSRYNGMTAGSYCYKAGKFSFGDSTEIADGSAKLKFNHASNWLIAITDTAAEDVSADAAISAKGDNIDLDKNISHSLPAVIIILSAAFICIKRSRQK